MTSAGVPKVAISIRTKLLLSVVFIFFVVVVFLNVSTVLILQRDKLAYVYRAQATEASLESRAFVDKAKTAIETLRILLGAIPNGEKQVLSPQQRSAFDAVVSNQSLILKAFVFRVSESGQNGLVARLATIANTKMAPDSGEVLSKLGTDLERAVELALNDLNQKSYAFVNIAASGEPLLLVLTSDAPRKTTSSEVVVAAGVVSLKELGVEGTGQSLTIASRNGSILFDKDPAVNSTEVSVKTDPLFQFALQSPTVTGAREFSVGPDHYLGTFVKTGLDLVVLSRTDWSRAMTATYEVTEKAFLLGLIAIAAAIIFSILFARTLTAPLLRLYEGTKQVATGNFNVRLPDTKKRDEIGALTTSFNAMSHEIEGLIVEKMEKVKLENELNIAATVQETLVPPHMVQGKRFRIKSHYQSASKCGGDWWGYFEAQDKLYVMVGDATGHGLPSALITAAARSCFSVLNRLIERGEAQADGMSPNAMLAFANRAIYEAAQGKINMTFFAGVIDFSTGEMAFANAGHNHPWLISSRNGEIYQQSLLASGKRLGERAELDEGEPEEVRLKISSGDILVLYTDGLIEGTNENGKAYGKARARKIIAASAHAGPEELIKSVVADFHAHNGEKVLDDDFTIAAILMS